MTLGCSSTSPLAEAHDKPEAMPVNKTVNNTYSPATKSQYDQALECISHLDNCNPESSFSFQIGLKEWYKLEELLGSRKYQRYSYNSSTSTLRIKPMASSIHQLMVWIVIDAFSATIRSLPRSVDSRISVAPHIKQEDFLGEYEGSVKIGDLRVIFREPARRTCEAVFALEVGFSESYDSLVQDAKLWLGGIHEVSVVLLIKLKEAPVYRNPILKLEDEGLERLELLGPREIRPGDFTIDGSGNITYGGFTWAGAITEAFAEVWRRDAVTGLAFKDGDRMDILTPTDIAQLKFRLSEFLSISPADDREISFVWWRYEDRIRDEMRDLAVSRYRVALGKRGGSVDPDYQPPSRDSESSSQDS